MKLTKIKKDLAFKVWTYQEPVQRILKEHYNAMCEASNKVWFNPKTHKKRKPDTKTIANWKRACTRIHKKYTKKLEDAVGWNSMIPGKGTKIKYVNYTFDGSKYKLK